MRHDQYEDDRRYTNAVNDEQREEVRNAIDSEGPDEFLAAEPTWDREYRNDANATIVVGWLRDRRLPLTQKNLSTAFHVARVDGTITRLTPDGPVGGSQGREERPAVIIRKRQPVDNDLVAGGVYNSAEPGIEELSRMAGDPNLSDNERKNAMKLLKLAATKERVSGRDENFERNRIRSQPVVI
jgi:hypothetical protein